MKTLYFTVFLIVFARIGNSQVNSFQLSYGGSNNDVINSVIPIGEDGYILFGTTSNFSSNGMDIILARINGNGDFLWINRYGGAQDETAEHAELTADGGYILAANTTSNRTRNSDLLVIKTDNRGNVTWSRTFGGAGNDFSTCIKEVPDGGYILAGRTQSFGQGGDDGYLIRINNQGNINWSSSYGTNNNERFYYVENTDDNGFIITGIENTSNFSRYDQLVMKINNLGNIIFSNSFGDNGGPANDAGDCIRQTPDGGYAFSGHYQSFGAGGLDLALTKIDSTGRLEWARAYGNNRDERAWDFLITEDNGYLLSGYTSSYGNGNNDALAILTRNDGTVLWSKTYGGSSNDEFNECSINEDSILFVGFTQSIGVGGQDMYVVKSDFEGTLQEDCRNIRSNIINSNSITPSVRRVNQLRGNLNQLTTSSDPNIQRTSIVVNNITSSNPCLTTTPVTLINFSFCKEEFSNSLCWQTSNEINTRSFIIEQSLNGITFDSIGYLNANNNGEELSTYHYPLQYSNKNAYYRLKIIDFDGYNEHSIILYNYNESLNQWIFPTYFSTDFTIKTPPTEIKQIDLEIVDINGIQKHKYSYSNEESISINTFSWPQGIFFVILTTEETRFITKIIKE